MKAKVITIVCLLVFTMSVHTQIVWSENFSGYASCTRTGANNNTANPAADWTTIFLDCDDASSCTIGQSFFGTNAGEFVINDIEGGPCSCGTGGTCDNTLTTETIDISAYGGVTISLGIRHDGGQEAGAFGGCDNSEDITLVDYSLDGGPFTPLSTNGALNGNWPTPTSGSQTCVSGSTLVIRITSGNKANTETVYFDNIIVDATTCPPLPVELNNFYLSCIGNNKMEAVWNTSSETNNSHFIIEGSLDGIYYEEVARVEGNGNSNTYIDYLTTFQNQNNYLYFRLIQVDINAMSTTYPPVFADCISAPANIETFLINGSLQISLPNPQPADYQIDLVDLTGKIIQSSQQHQTNSMINVPIPPSMSAGLYVIGISNLISGKKFYSKIFVP